MFFNIEPKKETTENKGRDISAQEAFGLLMLALAVLAYMARAKIERFYFHNFEEINLLGYLLIVGFAVSIIFQVKKHTKKLSDRAALLLPLAENSQGIFIGKTSDGVSLHVSDESRTGHSQIIAATGKGKTLSVVLAWLLRDIARGKNALLIDGKGDPSLVEAIKRVAGLLPMGPQIQVFDLGNPKTSCATNPLESGSPQQITDRIFTAFQFQDAYYKAVQYDIAGNIIQLICEVDNSPVTFKRLHTLLTDDDVLMEAMDKCTNERLKKALTMHLSQPRSEREQKLSGLLSQLAPFAVGEVAELVNGETNDRKDCTVSEVLLPKDEAPQKIFIVLIPTLKYQELGHQLGKLIMQEMGWAIGERASRSGENSRFLPVFLDEFSAFVYPGFANILNKARSSKAALHLSHQSLGDLGIVSPDFAKIITTNTNLKCILGLNDPETADWFARHLGTETSEKITEKAEKKELFSPRKKTGDMSLREVEAYKVHPNRLKNYANGRGVIHLPTALGNVTEEIQFERFQMDELT